MISLFRRIWAQRAHETRIEFDQEQLSRRHAYRGRAPESVESIRWDEVVTVTAHKLDLWATDEICLLFDTAETISLHLCESEPGWRELLEALPQYLPGFPEFETWYHEVAQPPFATNETRLYDRAS